MEQNQFESYLVKLNLHSLFSLVNNFDDYFITQQYVCNDDIHTYGELSFSLSSSGVKVKISHVGLHINGWTAIDGSLAERRVKILQYLIDSGYVPAAPFLREYKIDSLMS